MAMLTSTPPSITSINGKVYNNKPFNGQTAKTLTKQLVSIDTLDAKNYFGILINLKCGVLVWAYENEADRDSNYTNLETNIP